ncbi:hypothetical protein C0V75_09610 [Tabrizicola sp. TH137]|uniref:hypothetical protein n=1 Tax=Tabrizicola sp. TH137 TaxID=2067452 RepID=UPI000C7B7B30|nr:hypothetical protein [Tabrizicola sp. TH137]PLL13603.1 hypothetical protein C0V75_09610 [Tabrizicola sp. TH137]
MSANAIVFFATSKSGLGHLRRSATIARALRRAAPTRALRLVTNAPPQGLDPEDLSAFDRITVADRAAMPAAAGPAPFTAVLDTMNLPELESPATPRILVLRETPDAQLSRFQPAQHPWSRVLIANPANHWLPRMPEGSTQDVVSVGWIYRMAKAAGPDSRSRPRLLIATGGGGTEQTAADLYDQIGTLLTRLRHLCPLPFDAIQAIGPRARSFGQVPGIDAITDPGGSLNRLFHTADAVISTAGYNSVLELATTTTPTHLIPIPRSIDDQDSRVRLWSPRLAPANCLPLGLTGGDWLAHVLHHRLRRPPVDLGPSGEDRAARAILAVA